MTTKSLKNILNGKKLTGKEVGRLVIQNNVEEIRSYREGNQKTLFKQEELDCALRDMDSYNIEIYNCYTGLLRTILTYFNIGQSQLQQLYHYIFRCCFIISTLREDLKEIVEAQTAPIIMTKEEYHKRYNESVQEALAQEESYIDAFITATHYYTSKLEQDAEADNILTGLIKKLEDQPIKNKDLEALYIRSYVGDLSCGDTNNYYKLTNGKNSNEVTIREYMKDFLNRPEFAPLTPKGKEALKDTHYQLLYNDTRLTELMGDRTNKTLKANEVSMFMEFVIRELKARHLDDIASKVYDIKADTFRVAEDERPTQADLIKCNSFLISPYEDDKDNIEVFKAYLKELPELADIINKDLKAQKCFKAFEDIKPKDYNKPLVSWKVLYDKDIYNYKKRVEERFTIDEPRATNGIATVEDNTFSDYALKNWFDNGVYRGIKKETEPPDIEGIDRITDNLFMNAISSLLAFDTFLQDIEDIYNIKGLHEAYKADIKDAESYIRSLKMLIGLCIDDACSAYGYETHKAMELEKNLHWLYAQLDFNKYKPTEETQEKARAYISDIKNFKGAGQSMKYLELYMSERFKGVINEE